MPTFPIRRMTLEDSLAAAHLTQKVGWFHHATAWQRLLKWSGKGAFCITESHSDKLISTGVAICYGQQRAWLAMVITLPGYRGRGMGTRITQTIIDYAKGRGIAEIMLDATSMGSPIYEKAGFRALYKMKEWEGVPVLNANNMPSSKNNSIRFMKKEDWPAIAALDAQVFGADRAHIIQELAQIAYSGWVEIQEGQLVGFILAVPTAGDKLRVGPWIHLHPDHSSALFRTALSDLQEHHLRIDIAEHNIYASQQAADAGLISQRFCWRMIYGDTPPPSISDVYCGAAGLAIG